MDCHMQSITPLLATSGTSASSLLWAGESLPNPLITLNTDLDMMDATE
jgi:hypothetical protein